MSLIRPVSPFLSAALVLVAIAPPGGAQCLEWDPAFSTGGMNDTVARTAVFDDGTGPALYAVGRFHEASGTPARFVARWDGAHWNPLPQTAGAPTGELHAIHAWDDGNGPALYVGGNPPTIGDGSSLRKWNGSAWSTLPGGPTGSIVFVIEDFQGWLYVGGGFQQVSGQFQPGITRFNGSVWGGISGVLGSTGNFGVRDMQVFDDGTGPALYVGGSFDHAGTLFSPKIARWDGDNWSAVADFSLHVSALTVFDAGDGPELVAAGQTLEETNGAVKRLHAGAWLPLGGNMNGFLRDVVVHDDGAGGGPKLYAGGGFSIAGGISARNVARLDGASWSALGPGTNGVVRELCAHEAGGAPQLFALGAFTLAGDHVAQRAARWDGAAWSALETNNTVVGVRVAAMARFDDGHGDALFVAGNFQSAGDAPGQNIARWDGTTWWNLHGGMTGELAALAVHDDGAGEQLYIGGSFDSIDGIVARGIARWNGTAWSALASPVPPLFSGTFVQAFAVHDDGSGPALYVGGDLGTSTIGNQKVARWQNGAWSALGAGLQSTVHALVVHDDGTGPALYAGGSFTASGSVPMTHVARWNGTAWSDVGGGFLAESLVRTLLSFDDGTGPALYAGGFFAGAGGVVAQCVARFKDGTWSALGGGLFGAVYALAVHDDGSGRGPALYAGGSFTSAGGVIAKGVARWDGAVWTPLGSGVGNFDVIAGTVRALAAWDNGSGRDLYAGGTFDTAGSISSQNFARFQGCGETGRTFCFGDGSGAACPCGNASAPGDRAGCLHSLGTGGTVRASGEPSLSDDTLVLHGASMTNSAVLYFQGMGAFAGGTGAAFGDGLRCLTGPIIRMSTKINVAGASTYPVSGDLALSVRGAVFTPGKRTYQARFRNPAAFCTVETFNYTNAVEIIWVN